jgi:hypothetical protein
MSPHGSESMTFSDVATVCIFESLLWFAATKLQILFHIAAFFYYLLYIIRRKHEKMSFVVFIKAQFFGETFHVVTFDKTTLHEKPYIALSGEGRLRLGIVQASLALHSACTALDARVSASI